VAFTPSLSNALPTPPRSAAPPRRRAEPGPRATRCVPHRPRGSSGSGCRGFVFLDRELVVDPLQDAAVAKAVLELVGRDAKDLPKFLQRAPRADALAVDGPNPYVGV
jgi:hypothetical protein